MTRSKRNYRIRKARKRLTNETLDIHSQLQIVSVTWWASHGAARIDDKLNQVARMRNR